MSVNNDLTLDAGGPAVTLTVDGEALTLESGTQVTFFNPAPAAANITPDEHKILQHLIHFISEGPADGFTSGAFKEVLPTGVAFHTSETWYVDNTKAKKIVEKLITRPFGFEATPTPVVWKMYDADGTTVIATITDDIVYSGVFESTRTRTIA